MYIFFKLSKNKITCINKYTYIYTTKTRGNNQKYDTRVKNRVNNCASEPIKKNLTQLLATNGILNINDFWLNNCIAKSNRCPKTIQPVWNYEHIYALLELKRYMNIQTPKTFNRTEQNIRQYFLILANLYHNKELQSLWRVWQQLLVWLV